MVESVVSEALEQISGMSFIKLYITMRAIFRLGFVTRGKPQIRVSVGSEVHVFSD